MDQIRKIAKAPDDIPVRLSGGSFAPKIDHEIVIVGWDWLYPRLTYPQVPVCYDMPTSMFGRHVMVLSSRPDKSDDRFSEILIGLETSIYFCHKTINDWKTYLDACTKAIGGWDKIDFFESESNFFDDSPDELESELEDHLNKTEHLPEFTKAHKKWKWLYMENGLGIGETKDEALENGLKKLEDKLLMKEDPVGAIAPPPPSSAGFPASYPYGYSAPLPPPPPPRPLRASP